MTYEMTIKQGQFTVATGLIDVVDAETAFGLEVRLNAQGGELRIHISERPIIDDSAYDARPADGYVLEQ